MNINSFLGTKKDTQKEALFEKKTKDCTEEEKRALEMQMFKPDKIPPYSGSTEHLHKGVSEHTIKLVFRDKKDNDLFRKYVKVYDYIEPNTKYIDIIMAFLKSLESGELKYEGGKIVNNTRRKSKMGTGKQGFKRKV